MVGQGIPKGIAFCGLNEGKTHPCLALVGGVHDWQMRRVEGIEIHRFTSLVEVVVLAVFQVHAQDGAALPHVDVQGAVHGGVDFRLGAGVHAQEVVDHLLKVHVVEALSFNPRGAQMRFDALGGEESRRGGIHDLDLDAGNASVVGFMFGKAEHPSQQGDNDNR